MAKAHKKGSEYTEKATIPGILLLTKKLTVAFDL